VCLGDAQLRNRIVRLLRQRPWERQHGGASANLRRWPTGVPIPTPTRCRSDAVPLCSSCQRWAKR